MPPSHSPKEQVDAARRAVLAVPSPELAVLAVTGKDRVSWLNGLVTCDLGSWGEASEGNARYALVVSRSGRVLGDPILVADGDRALAVVSAPVAQGLREHLDHHLVMEDAEMAPSTDGFETWMLHGPRTDGVVAAARAAGGIGGTIDRTGLGGAIVLAPNACADACRTSIERAVAAEGGLVGDGVGWEALRLERGVPTFGTDFDEKTYPQEASLEKAAVSFKKGCYLGQEVVCMLEMRGHVKRKLVSIVLDRTDEGLSPAAGSPVVDEAGSAVGEVTSMTWSPTLGVPVGLAMLKRAQAVEGTAVVVAGAHAKVVHRPA